MKQLLVLSGKGGTGKTTIVSSLIKLSNTKAYADCDVDAPNLHLIVGDNNDVKKTEFYGMKKAFINRSLCIGCGKCISNCRFSGIRKNLSDISGNTAEYVVNEYACEGCGLCAELCESGAISLRNHVAGQLMLESGDKCFSTAKLKTGSGNSGLLVTEVKNQLKNEIKDNNIDSNYMIIDGSPGIGCPVIASLSGVDLVLIVTEPTQSGLSDLERIMLTADKLNVKQVVCVNKYDINIEMTDKIKKFVGDKGIPFLGVIPFDKCAIDAVNSKKSVVEVDCKSADAIKEIYKKLEEYM